MSDQLVSIIIPAHNSEKHIRETILCALGQTWPDKEVIVINNGSTDGTADILSEFADVVIINSNTGGAAAARNKGLQAAKGKYIQFLDADDLLSADKIAAQMAILNGLDDFLAICPTVQFKNGEDPLSVKPDDNWYYEDHSAPAAFLIKLYAGEEQISGHGGFVTVHSWLTPKAVIDKAGPWNEQLSTDDDGEFFCRVVLASKGIKFSKEGLNYYRKYQAQNSLSGQRTRKSYESAILATDLKLQWLKAANHSSLINPIFARFYWWTGVSAYPIYKDLSKQCIKKAKALGYSGPRYVGGRSGHTIARFLGWKAARILSHYKHN